MLDLAYYTVQQIEIALREAELENLVAVFSHLSDEHLLMVYNAEECPSTNPASTEAILLDDLGEVDPEDYATPWVGISALDAVCTQFATKGSAFYPLDRILVDLDRRPTLHRTLQNLARYLVDLPGVADVEDATRQDRIVSKILQLALPALLDQRGAEGLVAVCPGSDLSAFVEGDSGTWLRIEDSLTSIPAIEDSEWLVALEEVSQFEPQIAAKKREFLDLRRVLRDAGQGAALRETCRRLALYGVKGDTDTSASGDIAWGLMLETWLGDEDVTDLVIFFPHAELDHFAQTGEGLRVYRQLDDDLRRLTPGPRWTLADLVGREIPPEFRQAGFSLLPSGVLPGIGEKEIMTADLGSVLWRAGHEASLAQTLIFLARDGLEGAPGAVSLPLKSLSETVHRALLLITLGDPWAWRQGRYAQLVSSVYETLGSILSRLAESGSGGEQDFYRAMAYWYNCHRAQDVRDHLREMATHLRSYLRSVERDEQDPGIDLAQRLIEIEEVALYPLARGADGKLQLRLGTRMLTSDMDRMRRMMAHQEASVDLLSPLFERAWSQFRGLLNERHHVLVHERSSDVQRRKLEELLAHGRQHRRLLFAPPHEMAVLHFVYDREIDSLMQRVHELRTEARLEIVPISPRLDFQRVSDLTFEVCNTGRVDAEDIELVLARDASFDSSERSLTRHFRVLQPGVPQRFSYRVHAVTQRDASFRFSYHHRGSEEMQQLLIRLPVRSLDQVPFQMKGDPYHFGRAIQRPADFYGRGEEIRRLLSSLYRGGHTNFLLRGPRRMGKTSILHMLEHALEQPIVRRRFDIPEQWDASLDCFRPVLLDLQAFDFQDDETHLARFFRALLTGVCANIAPESSRRLLLDFDDGWREIGAPNAVLGALEDVFSENRQAHGVVLLDEYDEIYQPRGRSLDTALRHVVQSEQRLTWIMASTQFLFKESKDYGSPWFNIFDIVELDCLSPRAAERLVEEPSQNERVEWLSDAIVVLLDETGRHPAFLQLFCSRIMAYLNRERSNYVLPETISLLAEEIVEERETVHSHFEFYWSDTSGVGRLILLAADKSTEPPSHLDLRRRVEGWLQESFGSRHEQRVADARGDPVAWWEREFDDGMGWVTGVVNAISFDKAARTYTFTVPLFRRWLQHRRRYQNLLDAALAKVEMELERDGLD